ncbi:MAG: hypothetical protein L0Y56_06120 [Nitrospira sp.]|nr:hypothetical protein [Nitrospira sp.]
MDDKIARHVFSFNPQDNGGESVLFTTDLHDNGGKEPNFYITQEITLLSYCNEASIRLAGATITPGMLRKLANELDEFLTKEKAKHLVKKAA